MVDSKDVTGNEGREKDLEQGCCDYMAFPKQAPKDSGFRMLKRL